DGIRDSSVTGVQTCALPIWSFVFARGGASPATERPGSNSAYLISQRLAGFQRVGDAFLGFLFTAQGNESFAFEIKDVLFAHRLRSEERRVGNGWMFVCAGWM